MLRWVQVKARTRAGRGRVKFNDLFFKWLQDQILMVEDYAYTCTDFIEDPDLPLPPGEQWGDIDKKQETLRWKKCFLCFLKFYIFYVK